MAQHLSQPHEHVGVQRFRTRQLPVIQRSSGDMRLNPSARVLRQQAKAAVAVGRPRLDAVGNAVYANPNPRIFPQQDAFRGTWDATLRVSWSAIGRSAVGLG